MLIQSKNWQFLLEENGYHLYLNEFGVNSFNNLPAVIDPKGRMTWYLDDKIHRENDLPAFVDEVYGILTWAKHGKIHRENGPAHVLDNGVVREEQYWINGEPRTDPRKV